MIKKIIMIFAFFMAISTVSAIIDDAAAYYAMDNITGVLFDSTGNGNSVTQNANQTSAGFINEAFTFLGRNSVLDSTAPVIAQTTSSSYTVNVWFKLDTPPTTATLFQAQDASSNDVIGISYLTSGDITFTHRLSGGGGTSSTQPFTNDNDWHMATLAYNNTAGSYDVYIDGAFDGNAAAASIKVPTRFTIGNDKNLANEAVGTVDEVALYNRTLSSSEISTLYNGGVGVNPYTVPLAVVSFNSPLNGTWVNTTTNEINLTYSETTNASYIYNGASSVSLGTNIASSLFNLTGVEGLNNLSVTTNTSGELFNGFMSFTIDTTVPTITNNLPSTLDSYALSFNSSTCTDNNISTCVLTIEGSDYDLLTVSSTTLIESGNITYSIKATDTAGNTITENGLIFVNPVIYFSFNNLLSSSLVNNYTFGGRASVGDFVTGTIYNDAIMGVGNNTLLFSKFGFILQNFSFVLSNTTNTNYTFNVTPSFININIYDRETLSLITDTVNLVLEGDMGNETSTTTGTATLQAINGVPDDYRIVAESANYETEQVFFTYTNQENISIDIYMLNATGINTGFINIQVKASGNFVDDAIVQALEWRPLSSAYVSVAQCKTTTTGTCSLNIELNNVIYKFSATKSGVSSTTIGQIIDTTGLTLPIQLEDASLTADPDLLGLTGEFTETSDTAATNLSVSRFEWSDPNGVVGQACINVYKLTGFAKVFMSQNCTSSASGILFSSNLINNTYGIQLEATLLYDSTISKRGTLTYKGTGDISKGLSDAGLSLFIPLVGVLLAVAVGVLIGNIYISSIAVVIVVWATVAVFPSLISGSIAVVVTVIGGLILWGVSRR
jgi:hypothetical protein